MMQSASSSLNLGANNLAMLSRLYLGRPSDGYEYIGRKAPQGRRH